MQERLVRKTFIKMLKRLVGILGGPAAYRLGRALYKQARGDHPNDMATNGEIFVQECVANAWKQGRLGDQKLVVFDVGANVGDWSAAMLQMLPDREYPGVLNLYAFEPVPTTFAVLERRLGATSGVRLVNAALSSENGEAQIFVCGANAGSNSLHSDSTRGQEDMVRVATITTASFMERQGLARVHLLKCDTEGHDMEVIRGAMPLLRAEAISVLQFEYNHRWVYSRNFLRDVFAAVEDLPYRVAKLQRDCLLVFNQWHPELEKYFEGNYVLVHADALGWFSRKSASWDKFNAMRVNPA